MSMEVSRSLKVPRHSLTSESLPLPRPQRNWTWVQKAVKRSDTFLMPRWLDFRGALQTVGGQMQVLIYFGLGTQPIEQSASSNCAFGGQYTFGFTGMHKKLAGVCSRSSDSVHPGPHSCADNLALSTLPLSTGPLGMPVISGPANAFVIDMTMVTMNAIVSN
jgi:hypothetical protein